jgi:hypothetical protein
MTPNSTESERIPMLMVMCTALGGATVMAAAAMVLLLMMTHL